MSVNLQMKLEEQSLKITRYEKRLNDIVAAYKGILRENKALQSTIEALNASNKKQSDNIDNKINDENDSSDSKEQNDRISQLSSSISTLLSEKSHMENKYLSEKREIKKDFTMKIEQNEILIMKLNNQLEKANLKEKEQSEIILKYKHQSEKLQSDTSIQQDSQHFMFKEVQDLLAKERGIRVQLETQLQEHNKINKTSYITSIEKDLDILSFKLKNKDTAFKNQQQIYMEQLNKSKSEFEKSLQSEINKVEELRKEMKIDLVKHEKNTSKLEVKINELTNSLSGRSSLEITHEELLKNLRDKVTQLSEENYHLSLLNSTEDTESCAGSEFLLESADQLKMKIIEYCNKLKEMGVEESHLHSNCINKYKILENEYIHFKLNTEETLLKLNSADNNDLTMLKMELKNEKSKLTLLNRENEIFNQEIIDKHKAELILKQEELQALHNEQLCNLRQEVSEQRIRTMKIIEEKEQNMKANYDYKKKREKLERANLTLTGDLNSSLSSGEFPIIHYSEEISRLENECKILRKEKYDLRTNIRDNERDSKVRECNLKIQLTKCQDIISSCNNSSNRVNVNIDYIKNVVFALLSSPRDKNSYTNLVSALTTALHFSSKEKEQVNMHSMKKSWW